MTELPESLFGVSLGKTALDWYSVLREITLFEEVGVSLGMGTVEFPDDKMLGEGFEG